MMLAQHIAETAVIVGTLYGITSLIGNLRRRLVRSNDEAGRR
jgi:hypothetical protein